MLEKLGLALCGDILIEWVSGHGEAWTCGWDSGARQELADFKQLFFKGLFNGHFVMARRSQFSLKKIAHLYFCLKMTVYYMH